MTAVATPPLQLIDLPTRRGTAAHRATSTRATVVVAALLMGSFLCPSDLTVKVGATLTLLRFVLVVLLFPALLKLFRKMNGGRYVPVASDAIVVALVIWSELALVVTGGAATIATPYGIAALEFLSAYLIGRCFFADPASIERFVQVVVVVCALMLLIGLVDTISGKNVFGQLAKGKFADPNVTTLSQYRFGLARARGPLEHSIIYGLFFAICATLIFFLAKPLRLKLAGLGVCVAGTLIALSSAPILSFAVFVAFALYDRLLSGSRWRWRALLGLAAYGVAVILIVYEDPVHQLIRTFTLDPETGLYRLLIWKWVAFSIESSPLFGVGAGDWTRLSTMTPSVDALWLNQALRAGYGGVMLLAATVLGAFFVITPRRMRMRDDPAKANARKAVTIAIIQMLFISLTVHFWGSAWALFALLIGIRAGLSEARYLPDPGFRLPTPLHRRALAEIARTGVARPTAAGRGGARRAGSWIAAAEGKPDA